ncbi:DnaQ-like DNA polymerase III subunit [Streptomyces phage Yaboi]|uniref:DnaQ-like DNA polymerase III subunit n=3 Tax=Streptomyces virus Yaboi TaxID=2846408 RepID=A0A385UHH1_9CAUD|nr:Rnase H [Streptomyces phage Yaboi]QAY08812.1 DnaQ-like DNA polymerase III subunit [Streptomyces phage Genie2]QAY12802.1 DnaQ-like DNA polymerase III subunit [Streptomyces phage BoomerJR]UVD39996.1 DnaQ-like DNA polymerase III subunit [Streptomyces phage Stanimal]WNM73738.1 DnaQ-like DNA polymerase III subunit [Streptomyces phage Sollertia]AYB70988.1 DnaQ-like DNA polymerase III subunit [Streptomyces phage Yaboi]
MKIFYDTEFYETGPEEPIRFISLGAVREDGEKLYLITNNLYALNRANENPWLAENVISHLPVKQNGDGSLSWDTQHPDYARVLPNEAIAGLWRDFVLDYDERDYLDKPELWAYYGAYDHVVVSQLFGRMIDLPDDMPMYTMDLKQRWHTEGMPALPPLEGSEHNALDDAMWNKVVSEYLDSLKG